MEDYVERIINEFSMKISRSDTDLTPYVNNIFEKGNSKRLSKKENEKLHTSVERGIF